MVYYAKPEDMARPDAQRIGDRYYGKGGVDLGRAPEENIIKPTHIGGGVFTTSRKVAAMRSPTTIPKVAASRSQTAAAQPTPVKAKQPYFPYSQEYVKRMTSGARGAPTNIQNEEKNQLGIFERTSEGIRSRLPERIRNIADLLIGSSKKIDAYSYEKFGKIGGFGVDIVTPDDYVDIALLPAGAIAKGLKKAKSGLSAVTKTKKISTAADLKKLKKLDDIKNLNKVTDVEKAFSGVYDLEKITKKASTGIDDLLEKVIKRPKTSYLAYRGLKEGLKEDEKPELFGGVSWEDLLFDPTKTVDEVRDNTYTPPEDSRAGGEDQSVVYNIDYLPEVAGTQGDNQEQGGSWYDEFMDQAMGRMDKEFISPYTEKVKAAALGGLLAVAGIYFISKKKKKSRAIKGGKK